jgi:hypothetical protein
MYYKDDVWPGRVLLRFPSSGVFCTHVTKAGNETLTPHFTSLYSIFSGILSDATCLFRHLASSFIYTMLRIRLFIELHLILYINVYIH